MATFHEQGKYKIKIAGAALIEAKSEQKTPQIELTLELIGQYGDNDELFDCRRGRFPPRIFLSISEKTMGTENEPGWVAETLKVLGFNGDFEDMEQFTDKEANAWCGYKPDLKGEEREDWSIDRPREARSGVTIEKKGVRTLKTKFGNLFKGDAAEPTKPTPRPKKKPDGAQPPAEPSPTRNGTGDEIPF